MFESVAADIFWNFSWQLPCKMSVTVRAGVLMILYMRRTQNWKNINISGRGRGAIHVENKTGERLVSWLWPPVRSPQALPLNWMFQKCSRCWEHIWPRQSAAAFFIFNFSLHRLQSELLSTIRYVSTRRCYEYYFHCYSTTIGYTVYTITNDTVKQPAQGQWEAGVTIDWQSPSGSTSRSWMN